MPKNFRTQLFEIIFEADTKAGRAFDIGLLILILLSIATVICESVPALRNAYHEVFLALEWTFTFLFLLEYLLRIYSAGNRIKYIFSFFGLIDLLAILPAFLGLFLTGAYNLIIIRAFRLLRVFRILKINRYSTAGQTLLLAIRASRAKISVFLFTLVTAVLLLGTLMYVIEGEIHGFTSIPKSIYWAIVTITTVGYGDLTPQTPLGQFVSALLMILGYAIIAVPTGIISVEMARTERLTASTQVCPSCHKEGHTADAHYCKYCGQKINPTL